MQYLSTLDRFIVEMQSAWGPLNSAVVTASREAMARLVGANINEQWLADLLEEQPASRELHRDRVHGFMLLAHTEQQDLFRPPHDHGRAWVVYAVQSGALEIRTYARIGGAGGRPELVLRDQSVLRPGEARAYLPGDIHSTRCVSESALLFRFTERDLRHEDQVERKLTRFVDYNGVWTVADAQ